jgi:hypothetical protein
MKQTSEARTTLPRCARRVARLRRHTPLLVAIAAVSVSCSFLPTATASAGPLVCSPEEHVVSFSEAGHNSATFKKRADGCAQPWLSYIAETAIIKLWVEIGGSYHNLTNTECVAGGGTCDLDSSWGTACEGESCNGHKFHLQWANYQEDDITFAELKD